MDSVALPRNFADKCCDCECRCTLTRGSGSPSSGSWTRSVKRKHAELDEEVDGVTVPGIEVYYNAKVQVDHECNALREALSRQQQTIQDLYTELDEERNASSSATSEAMSMMLRLQREKAEIQMEARQFKLFVEEKMAHDQWELVVVEDLLYKREQTIQALMCELQAYKHRRMSYGLSEADADGAGSVYSQNQSMGDCDSQYDLTTPIYEYPPLKCKINVTQGHLDEDDAADIEKFAFGETPHDHLKNLEDRLYQMERSPSNNQLEGDVSGSEHIYEKGVVGHSLRQSRNSRIVSNVSTPYTVVVGEAGADFLVESPKNSSSSFKRAENVSQSEDYSNMRKLDDASEIRDDMSDRIYTIDSVHSGAPCSGLNDVKPGIDGDYKTAPRGALSRTEDPDIMKLYMRLQALEADRESMRQAMLSIRTDKAQLVLLKEIAQHLYRDKSADGRVIVKKQAGFLFMSVFKWVKSLFLWRRRARQSKYMFGLSASVGLPMLLDKGPYTRQWRCLTSTHI